MVIFAATVTKSVGQRWLKKSKANSISQQLFHLKQFTSPEWQLQRIRTLILQSTCDSVKLHKFPDSGNPFSYMHAKNSLYYYDKNLIFISELIFSEVFSFFSNLSIPFSPFGVMVIFPSFKEDSKPYEEKGEREKWNKKKWIYPLIWYNIWTECNLLYMVTIYICFSCFFLWIKKLVLGSTCIVKWIICCKMK